MHNNRQSAVFSTVIHENASPVTVVTAHARPRGMMLATGPCVPGAHGVDQDRWLRPCQRERIRDLRQLGHAVHALRPPRRLVRVCASSTIKRTLERWGHSCGFAVLGRLPDRIPATKESVKAVISSYVTVGVRKRACNASDTWDSRPA